MKLDRNTNPHGRGKYALIKLRVAGGKNKACQSLGFSTIPNEAIDYGDTPDTEFFVLRLKDQFAAPALRAYANAVFMEAMRLDRKAHQTLETSAQASGLREYGWEIERLADIAEKHPNQKIPD